MKQIFNLKSYFTFLSRNKVYTAINALGFSISFAFVILIGLYYQRETGVDKNIEGVEQLYTVDVELDDGEQYTGTSRVIIPLLMKQLPQIESGCALHLSRQMHAKTAEGMSVKVEMLLADSTFYPIFRQKLEEGSTASALKGLSDVVISRKLAQTLFADGNAIGKVVECDGMKLHVQGVYDKMAGTSFPDCDIIGRFELMRESAPWFFRIDGNFGETDVVLKLKPGTDAASLEKSINAILSKAYKEIFEMDYKFHLVPFSESYFSDVESYVFQRGKPGMVRFIFLIGVLILVFSIMNYINLTTALSGYRAREMATRRLLGSQKGEILCRLVAESVVFCCCSVLISVLLSLALIPSMNHLLETEVTASDALSAVNLLLLTGVVLAIGILAGILPASIQSRVSPIDIVRGTFRRQTKMRISKMFIVIQNVITITFIALTIVFSLQVSHLINAPLGYETEHVMEIDIPEDARKAELFKAKVLKLSSVEKASLTSCSPLRGGFNQMAYVEKQPIRCQRFYVDMDYLDLLGIDIVKKYAEGDSVMTFVTPNFHHLMRLAPDATKFRYREDAPQEDIHGVIKDFHLYSSNATVENQTIVVYCFRHAPSSDLCGSMLVKTSGNDDEAFRQVQDVYKEVYQEELAQDHPFLKQVIRNSYKQTLQIIRLLALFSFVAILISMLGLVAMSTYFIQQRNKEIALRKVFGSTGNQIRRKLIRTFLGYVGIAFLIGAPLSWFLISEWISAYSYRIVWWPWIIVSGILVVLIAIGSVVVQSYVASNENPVKHLKQE